MAVICPYCETENPDRAEVCRVCNESLEDNLTGMVEQIDD